MFTLPPVNPGQPSLTMARIGVSIGAMPNPARTPVIVAMGDDLNQSVKAFGQYGPDGFLYVVGRLFPDALKDPPKHPGMLDESDAAGNQGRPLASKDLFTMLDFIRKVIEPMIIGRIVNEELEPPEISGTLDAKPGTGEVVGLEITRNFRILLKLKNKDDPEKPFTVDADQIQ